MKCKADLPPPPLSKCKRLWHRVRCAGPEIHRDDIATKSDPIVLELERRAPSSWAVNTPSTARAPTLQH